MATPEHKLLEKWAGTWEASRKMQGPPDTPPMTAPGTLTSRVACGGLWLVADFDGSIMGMPFSGHETVGYDPTTKKYLLVWVDSMSTSFAQGEGTYDAKTNTMTFLVKGRDMTGAAATWRQTDVWKDADNREWAMWKQGPDGKDAEELRITYRRKK